MGVTPSLRADGESEIRRDAGDRSRQGATPTPSPLGHSASSREARPPRRGQRRRGPLGAAEAGKEARVPAHPPAGGRSGPYLSLGAGWGWGAAREGSERGSPAGSPPGRRARSKGRGAQRTNSVSGPGQAGRAGRGGTRRRRPVSQSRRCPLGAAAETAGTGPREEPQPERQRSRRGRGGATGSATRSPGSSCGRGGARCAVGLIPVRRSAPGFPAASCAPRGGRLSCRSAPPLRATGAALDGARRGAIAAGAEARGGLEVAPPGLRFLPGPSAPGSRAGDVN